MSEQTDLDAGAALRPALDAFRRGTKRSRLRVFAAVCRNGHTLLEVFPTSAGPVALWASRERYGIDESGDPITYSPARKVWHVAFVTTPEKEPRDWGEDRAAVACRCTEATQVDLRWVQQELDTDTRRAVAPD